MRHRCRLPVLGRSWGGCGARDLAMVWARRGEHMTKGLSFYVMGGRGTWDAGGGVDAADAGGAGSGTMVIRWRNGVRGTGARVGNAAGRNWGVSSRGVVWSAIACGSSRGSSDAIGKYGQGKAEWESLAWLWGSRGRLRWKRIGASGLWIGPGAYTGQIKIIRRGKWARRSRGISGRKGALASAVTNVRARERDGLALSNVCFGV
jgi:hypothetical protein